MSEQSQAHEGEQSGEGQQNVNVSELMERLKQLESTNARLLDENKKHKSRSRDAMTELEKIQSTTLEKEGDLQKILEAEKRKAEELADRFTSLKAKTIKANMRATVAKFASDVHDIDDLLNQPKYFDLLRTGIDEDSLEVNEEVAKDYVKKVTEAKPWLRKSVQAVGAVTTRPGYSETKAKDISAMTREEYEEHVLKTLK